MPKHRKIILLIITMALLVVTVAALSACNEDEKSGTLYTVTVKSGSNDDFTTFEIASGESFVLPESPFTRQGYSFLGWVKDGGSVALPAGANVTVRSDLTYIAEWKADVSYTVTLASEDGLNALTKEYADIAPGTQFVLPECPWEKTGYLFSGWETGDETLAAGESVTVSANIEAVAVWEPDPDYVPVKEIYTISFKDGYSDGIVSFEVDEDAAGEYTLPELFEEFLRTDDKVFVGWRAEGSDEILSPDETVAINKSTTFLAMWEDAVYTLIFSAGDQTVYEKEYASGSVVNAPAAPEKTGYAFVQWVLSTDSEATYRAGEAITVSEDMAFEAQYSILSYVISFSVGGRVVGVEVDHGEIPVCPIDVPESYIVDDYAVAVFTGWDKEIVAATGEATYTAVYENETRLYPVTFKQNGYVYFVVDGERVEEANVGYGESVSFTLERDNAGVSIENVKVYSNGVELTAEDGIYTVPWSSDSVVEVSGWELAEYRINFSYNNVDHDSELPEAFSYGSEAVIYAIGVEGYADSAPTVTYKGETVLPESETVVRGDKEYYVYKLTFDRNGDVEVNGVIDVIRLTFIDLNGEEIYVDWNATMGPVGTAYPELQFQAYGTHQLKGTQSLYFIPFVLSGDYFIAVTADTLDTYIVAGETEGQAIAQALADNPTYPVKGEPNVYHIIYYFAWEDSSLPVEIEGAVNIGITAPAGATEFRYFVEGGSEWISDAFADGVNDENVANFYTFALMPGNVVYFTATTPSGELPDLTDKNGENVSAGTYNVNGEDVLCYKITVTEEGNSYYCETENKHTVSFNYSEEWGDYSFLFADGSAINDTVYVRDGDDWTFVIYYDTSKCRALIDDFELVDGSYRVKEGRSPFSVTTADGLEAAYEYSAAYNSGISVMNVYITLKDVSEDIVVSATATSKWVELTFRPVDGYSIYVDDELLVAGEGGLVKARLTHHTMVKLVPTEGVFIVTGGYASMSYKCPNAIIPSIISTVTIELSFAEGGAYAYAYIPSYQVSSNNNATDDPVEFSGFAIGSYTLYHNESDCASTNELNNVSFPEGEPEYVGVDNVFSLKVQVPEGYVPVLLLEYAARLEEGYFRYNAVSVENNVYLFEVSGIDSEIGWAIELVPDEYEIVFVAGDTVTVLTLAYGTQFDTAPGVPEEYVSDGTEYTVTGWKNLAGETVFGVDGKSNALIAEGVAKG